MDQSSPACAPSRRRRFSWLAALLTLAILVLRGVYTAVPHPPEVLELNVTWPAVRGESIQPLIAVGPQGAADLIVARFAGPDRVAIGYDHWGTPAWISDVFTYRPGQTVRLTVRMPSLSAGARQGSATEGELDVLVDGKPVLSRRVAFYRADPRAIHFGVNPIHASATTMFGGKLRTTEGRSVQGNAGSYSSWGKRLREYLGQPKDIGLAALAGLLAGGIVGPLLRWLVAGGRSPATSFRPPHRWFAAASIPVLLGFGYVVTGGSGKIFYPEVFGHFYDFQAASLLQGRLDVPETALSGEAFIRDGKVYGYFGPTPALERLPFAVLKVGFGRLSRAMMLVHFAACLLGAYQLLRLMTRTGHGNGHEPGVGPTVLLTLATGMGSTLFFLGSRAYIYHEAILCGAAYALWSTYFSLQWLRDLSRQWWIGALLCGTLSVHARPPLGLFALTLLGTVAAYALIRLWLVSSGVPGQGKRTRSTFRYLTIGLASVLGVLSFNGLSYLKFRTFDGCPLHYHVQYDEARLARFDGKQFHRSNLSFGVDAYLLRPTLRFSNAFPYVHMRGLDPAEYGEVRLDMAEQMMGIPWAMPALTLLTLLSLGAAAASTRAAKEAAALLWIAIVPMAVALFAAVAVSHRYTGDFVPFLVASSACSTAIIWVQPQRWAAILRVTIAVAVACSVLVTVALTVSYQGAGVWGVPEETQHRYQQWKARADTLFGARS